MWFYSSFPLVLIFLPFTAVPYSSLQCFNKYLPYVEEPDPQTYAKAFGGVLCRMMMSLK